MSSSQLHKRMSTEQVIDIINKYQNKEIKAKEAVAYLQVSRARLYQLVAELEEKGSAFTVDYGRSKPTRRIDPAIERNIKRELIAEKKLIQNPDVPLKRYNYSYVRDEVKRKHKQKVSVSTVIRRAKKWDFYQGKLSKPTHASLTTLES